MPPIDPVDQPPSDDGLTGPVDAVDIGVDRANERQPPRQQLRQRDSSRTSPVKVVGAVAVVIALAAVVVGLMSGSDRDPANEFSLPTPTSPPEVSERPDPARPAPTATVQVPVVSNGLLRAGETCRIPLEQPGLSVAFTIPDGRTMRDCATGGPLLRDPGSETGDALGSVLFTTQTLGFSLNQLRGDERWVESTTIWQPVDNRRGYRLRRDTDDLGGADQIDLIEVPGGTLMVMARNRNFADDIPRTIEELVASIRVEGPTALPPPPLPQPGSWCGGDQFVTRVPAGWFAGEQCRWLNTSSESPIVLQCECLPPLWIEALDIPFDGDFGFDSIDVDQLVTRPNGSVVRVIEGLRRDANNMDRPLRVVIVDLGVKRIAVVATEFPEHVLPGHTWERTLAAQQFVVEHLRLHSQPGCGGEQARMVIDASGQRALILVTGERRHLPNGTLVETTGCFDEDQAEVRLVAAPEVVLWMATADLAAHQVDLCPSGERDFRPHLWLNAVVGDFDGDGRDDAAYVRDNAEGGADVAVVFANGGLAESTGLGRIDDLPSVERIAGVGNDLLQVVERRSDRGVIVSLLDASSCRVEALASWPLGFVDGARHNLCTATDGALRGFRAWSESFDDRQGWIVESDRFWFPEDGTLRSIDLDQSGAPSNLCGPVLAEFAAPVLPASIAGGALRGEHQLTLQWIEARDDSTGTIEFTPIGNDRYEVDGVHEAAFGFLSMRGVIERVDDTTLSFDGTIASQIPWLNFGDPCIRKAGQRFVLRTDAATPTYRMQDRINCDGARTDWIDIQLNE